ncbi:AAA domain-containing protein [Shewanella sp. 10N.286.51.B2]|uniref:AAA domain-containing protein n=1 Tax=Shewanella sp. 10N.286.51.B2 TaxID=3229707 RepID=UPI00355380E7
MRFKQLNIEISHTFWIEPFDGKGLTFTQGDLGQLRLNSRTGNLQLIIKGKLFTISLREPALLNDIGLGFARANANLIEVSRVHKQKDWPQERIQFELALASFNGPEIELGVIDIALDPRTLEQAKAAELGETFVDIKETLEQRCRLSLTDEPEQQFAIAVLGESALDQLKHLEQFEGDIDKADKTTLQQIKNGLVLLGDNLQLAVQQYSAVEFDYLGVRKLVTRSHRAPTRSLRLIKLQLNFSEQRQQMAILATQQLNEIISDQRGYLSTWDKYGSSEGEQLLKRARAVGHIKIAPENCQIDDDSAELMSIYVETDLRKLLTSQDSLLMVSPETPIAHLVDPDMDWKAFSTQMLESYKERKGFDSGLSDWQQQTNSEDKTGSVKEEGVPESNESTEPFNIVKVEQHRIVVKDGIVPSHNMVLALSILGDQVQIERRMMARSAIIEGKSAMPHLGLLIEEGATLPPGRDQRPFTKPLSSFVESKVFPKNEPTKTQRRAIKLALETPDIMVIQGPPGTGKTTVITAIIESLNQEIDKSKSVQGDILVTGYQHDAVENLLNRLSVNDLPAIKFGQRSGETAQSNSTDVKLDEWRQETVSRIYQNTPEIKESIAYLQLERDVKAYSTSPSDSAALRLVNKAKALLVGVPGSDELIRLLKDFSGELTNQQSVESDSVLILRSLRLSKAAFMDDGANRAAALLAWLSDKAIAIEEGDLKTLRQAVSWQAESELSFLPQLKKIKLQLLKRFTPKPHLKRVLAREDVKSAIQRTLDLLQDSSRNTSKSRALLEYLSDLEGNPSSVQTALAEYNLVYGATTGQSEGKDIRRFKSKNGDGKGYLQYGTVIVDEAARASPRDLMIPMVQAKDCIILVGDHRQLSHMVDDSLLEQMEKELDDTDDWQGGREQFNQHIKESMFEYLFNRAKKLEQQDGKSRTITLDAQYRSHPLLGKFASDQFYKPYGEGYESPSPASKFSQELDGIKNKAAVWLDAPAQLGKEERNASKSRFRKAEAELIAEQLKQWIDSKQGKGLSFGVISFYKAQVNEVMKALAKDKITVQNEQGDYVIAQKYQMLFDSKGKPLEERLRIGTVDSFQGMEFDVVFLSMVRCQSESSKFFQQRQFSAKEQQRVFGHLMSKSRLCVSVTRQKKALVVVGDSQLIKATIAKQAVPELQAFYELCKNNSHGVVK